MMWLVLYDIYDLEVDDGGLVIKSCLTLVTHGSFLCPWDSPGKKTGVGCHFLLQGLFSTQGSNPGLLHCRWTLYWATRETLKLELLELNLVWWDHPSYRQAYTSTCSLFTVVSENMNFLVTTLAAAASSSSFFFLLLPPEQIIWSFKNVIKVESYSM